MHIKLQHFRNLLFILAICAGVLSSRDAKACHFAAADIYVTYTGAGIDGCTGTTEYKYDVTLSVYLACQACTLDPLQQQTVQVTSTNAGPTIYNLTVDDVKGSAADPDTIHSLCPSVADSNSCKYLSLTVNRYPAFRRRVYTGTIILPSAQTDWRFYWSNGGRNTSNITGCGSLYIEAMLNNVTKYNNSTPRFTTNPLPYICVSQPNTYLNGPLDPNNDSVQVYQQTPYTPGAPFSTACGYAAPYSVADPIGSSASNPYTLNATTGAATFTPTNTGFFVLAFRAEDYERGTGIKLSHIYRDVQVSVLPCTAPPPDIDSLTPTFSITNGSVVPVIGGGKAVVACPGNNLNFSLNSKIPTPGHNLYMYANTSNIPGGTFNVTGSGTNSVTGTFAWVPTAADVGEHTLIITSADSTCLVSQPIVLRNYTVVYLKIINGLDAGADIPTCVVNAVPHQLFVKGFGNLDLSVHWTDISGGPAKMLSNPDIVNPVSTANGNTSYVVTASALKDKCKAQDIVNVYVDTSNTIDIFPNNNPFVQCRPDYLQLDAYIKGKGPANNMQCGLGNPNGNLLIDSLNVWGSPTYGTGIAYDTLGPTTPTLYNSIYTTRYQWLITKEEMKEYGFRSSTLKAMSFETAKNGIPTHEFANITISMKCVDASVKSLNKATGFLTGLTPVYTATANWQFPDGWHKFNFNSVYNWDTTKNLVVEICWHDNPALSGSACAPPIGLPAVIKFMPTTYIAGLELKGPGNNTITSVCGVNNDPNIKEFPSRPILRFDYSEAPGLQFRYTWTPGAYLSDSNSKNPLAYVSKSTNYVVETFGKNGCILRDTMNIYVPSHDFSVTPKDTSICFGEVAPLEVRKGVYYQWFEYENGKYLDAHKSLSCDYCSNPIAKPLKSTHYKIKVGDEVFCYDTIDAYIEVRPLPLVNILNNDTVVKYGQSVQLLVNGARTYNWTPVSSINNPNISYPVATPSEATMYVACGIGTNGCRAYDTVRVGLDYRDNLFIPSAFSPNGDGKNDMFRVSNMTFQRFVEFRVFNKWGQEVYNGGGGNPNKGWDGTWKGVAQDMGTYQYLIRVGYPDGLVETYKGDVTLVR